MRSFSGYNRACVEVLAGKLLLLWRWGVRRAVLLLLLVLLQVLRELADVKVGVVKDGLRIKVRAGALEHIGLSAAPSLVHFRIRWE